MSPERSGSPQDDQSVTPKMSVPASPVAGTPTREAQSPISLLLAVAQSQNTRNGDDDLTSLSWLHERDLLKGNNCFWLTTILGAGKLHKCDFLGHIVH